MGSDHRVVAMRVHLSLRVPKSTPRTRHNWKAVSTNPDLQTRYTEEVRKHLQLLDDEEEPRTEYMKFVAANIEATSRCVPVL